MKKGDIWKLLLNHTNVSGRRLLFTNSNGRYLIDITVKPVIANRIIDEVLEQEWEKDDLMAYLNTMSGNILDDDCYTCEA